MDRKGKLRIFVFKKGENCRSSYERRENATLDTYIASVHSQTIIPSPFLSDTIVRRSDLLEVRL